MNVVNDRTKPHLYVDVDGTLLIWPTIPGTMGPNERPVVNAQLVENIKAWQAANLHLNAVLVIWTMCGAGHAQMARDLCGFGGTVICIAKPDLAIDDKNPLAPEGKSILVLPAEFKP